MCMYVYGETEALSFGLKFSTGIRKYDVGKLTQITNTLTDFDKGFILLHFALAKQTTLRNIYKNIYLFSRRTIV